MRNFIPRSLVSLRARDRSSRKATCLLLSLASFSSGAVLRSRPPRFVDHTVVLDARYIPLVCAGGLFAQDKERLQVCTCRVMRLVCIMRVGVLCFLASRLGTPLLCAPQIGHWSAHRLCIPYCCTHDFAQVVACQDACGL